MSEIGNESVHLIVTSPPYWQLKDYGIKGQIGYDQSYEEYIASLNQVWRECHRVLHQGCRLCVNIGDQFARSVIYGRYKVIPIREEIIRFCESIGFDYMGAIIWQKQTTMNTTGGATVMGSFPYPRNGIVKIDYEFILLFKKLGKHIPKPTKQQKEASRMTQEEWDAFFTGHWQFGGERQDKHLAMFPEELPRRLIKMFTFVGETVLDPFIGSGTTALAARKLGRNTIGYEVDDQCLSIIQEKVGRPLEIVQGSGDSVHPTLKSSELNGIERIADPKQFQFGSVVSKSDRGKTREDFYRVCSVIPPNLLQLNTGLTVRLLGVAPIDGREEKMAEFLSKLVLRQRVRLEFDEPKHDEHGYVLAYVHAENKTFINAKLIREGYACAEGNGCRMEQLRRCEEEAKRMQKGLWAAGRKVEDD